MHKWSRGARQKRRGRGKEQEMYRKWTDRDAVVSFVCFLLLSGNMKWVTQKGALKSRNRYNHSVSAQLWAVWYGSRLHQERNWMAGRQVRVWLGSSVGLIWNQVSKYESLSLHWPDWLLHCCAFIYCSNPQLGKTLNSCAASVWSSTLKSM